jgi:S1-C subfamily serine protease
MNRLLLILLLSGCTTETRVYSEQGAGHGAILSENCIVTVAHVVKGNVLVKTNDGWKLAKELRRIKAEPEDLVILQVDGRLSEPIQKRALHPGDSGRPLYDADGYAIGLVCGMRNGAILLVPLKELE